MKKNIANFETFIIEQKACSKRIWQQILQNHGIALSGYVGSKDPAGYVAMGLIYYVLMRLTGSKGSMIAIQYPSLISCS